MRTELKNIKGLLGSLDRPFQIDGVEQRKFLQKLVYLAQALDFPTNYSFSWYIHGPYSPKLTQDYFDLDSILKSSLDDPQFVLSAQYVKIDENLQVLIDGRPPALEEPDWAELLASVVFLKQEAQLSDKDIEETLDKKKPHVSSYFSQAKDQLKRVNIK